MNRAFSAASFYITPIRWGLAPDLELNTPLVLTDLASHYCDRAFDSAVARFRFLCAFDGFDVFALMGIA